MKCMRNSIACKVTFYVVKGQRLSSSKRFYVFTFYIFDIPPAEMASVRLSSICFQKRSSRVSCRLQR